MEPGIAPGRADQRAADAAPQGAGKLVAAGAIDGHAPEAENDQEKHELNDENGGVFRTKANLQRHEEQDDGQDEHAENDQCADEKLLSAAGIFQSLAVDVDAAPDMAADIGLGPEPVDRQGYQVQEQIGQRNPE